ncbi:MAG: dihydrolipoamide acetyltransferase family protein [Chloroflexota bacterium]|nr:dihydrolipoamide acetyltransferase family protein [Chloroflexota bacterium]
MATAVVMPKLGNSVESSIIVNWRKRLGDAVQEGEALLEVETDKATVEVESQTSGTLLAIFYDAGADVPVMTPIAAIGQPGEDYSALMPAGINTGEPQEASIQTSAAPVAANGAPAADVGTPFVASMPDTPTDQRISPRARNLATRKGVVLAGMSGTGPGGRIIERDIQAALARQPKLTPVAERMVAQGGFALPEGVEPGKKITTRDLVPAAAPVPTAPPPPMPMPVQDATIIPMKGIRRTIATRMLASLQTTAQLTLNAYADARALKALRERLKSSDEALGLRGVTINDLVLYAAAKTLTRFPDVNAHLKDDAIHQYPAVHLGFAVDTPRGLIVPVIKNAHARTLHDLSTEAVRLAKACQDGSIKPDDLDGGTFTVSNLGGLGIDTFTPVLNPPQVAILGVGGIALRPVEMNDDVKFIPHIALSLTIDHRAMDGAPGARFLQALGRNLANVDVLLAT